MKYKNLSSNLARIRKERGLSQRDLAKLCGISARMIGHYELHITHPSLDKLEAIAKALNVTIDDLIDSHEKNKANNLEIDEIITANPRTIKQLKKILKLSPVDRASVYKYIDSLLLKQEYKQKVSNP